MNCHAHSAHLMLPSEASSRSSSEIRVGSVGFGSNGCSKSWCVFRDLEWVAEGGMDGRPIWMSDTTAVENLAND
jgi:hypothetical protein